LPHRAVLAQPKLAARPSWRTQGRSSHTCDPRPCQLRSSRRISRRDRGQYAPHERAFDVKAGRSAHLKLYPYFASYLCQVNPQPSRAGKRQLPCPLPAFFPGDVIRRPPTSTSTDPLGTMKCRQSSMPPPPALCSPTASAAVTATPVSTQAANSSTAAASIAFSLSMSRPACFAAKAASASPPSSTLSCPRAGSFPSRPAPASSLSAEPLPTTFTAKTITAPEPLAPTSGRSLCIAPMTVLYLVTMTITPQCCAPRSAAWALPVLSPGPISN